MSPVMRSNLFAILCISSSDSSHSQALDWVRSKEFWRWKMFWHVFLHVHLCFDMYMCALTCTCVFWHVHLCFYMYVCTLTWKFLHVSIHNPFYHPTKTAFYYQAHNVLLLHGAPPCASINAKLTHFLAKASQKSYAGSISFSFFKHWLIKNLLRSPSPS
jgi:hypothetical protein